MNIMRDLMRRQVGRRVVSVVPPPLSCPLGASAPHPSTPPARRSEHMIRAGGGESMAHQPETVSQSSKRDTCIYTCVPSALQRFGLFKVQSIFNH
jgi:hypothetical protein